MAAPTDSDGRFDRRVEAGEVCGGHEAAVLGVVGGHGLRDRAAVEEVMRGAQAAVAVAARRALRLDHPADAACELGLHEALADARRPAAGEKEPRAFGPAPVL